MTFFFSSRRRHTRLQGDWSSDVCSSDLAVVNLDVIIEQTRPVDHQHIVFTITVWRENIRDKNFHVSIDVNQYTVTVRSEERRVGKEWRHRTTRQRCKTTAHTNHRNKENR